MCIYIYSSNRILAMENPSTIEVEVSPQPRVELSEDVKIVFIMKSWFQVGLFRKALTV